MAEEAKRRLRARKFNEHMRLLSTSINALGLVVFGTGFIQPVVTEAVSPGSRVWIAIGFALHLTAHACLRLFRDEEL